MNKVELVIEGAKLLLDVAKNLHSLADSVQAVCTLVTDGLQDVKEVPAPKTEAKKTPAVTLEKVRGILADKSRAGHTAEVRAIITKYGAEKLSEINPANYEAVMKEAEEL